MLYKDDILIHVNARGDVGVGCYLEHREFTPTGMERSAELSVRVEGSRAFTFDGQPAFEVTLPRFEAEIITNDFPGPSPFPGSSKPF